MAIALAYLLSLVTTFIAEVVGQIILEGASLIIIGAFGRAGHRAAAVASGGTVLLSAALAKSMFLLCGAHFGLWALLLASLPHLAIITVRYLRFRDRIELSAILGALAALVALLVLAS